MEEKIKELINEGEGQSCEFKLAKEDLPKNLFETVCAFLNTSGPCKRTCRYTRRT